MPKYGRGPFTWLMIGLLIMFMLMTLTKMNRVQKLKYSEFKQYVEMGYVAKAVLNESSRKIEGEFHEKALMAIGEGTALTFEVGYTTDLLPENAAQWLEENHVSEYDAAAENWMLPLLVNLLPLVLIVGLIYFFFLRNMKSGGVC